MVEQGDIWGGLISEQPRERLELFFDFDDAQPITADQLGTFLYGLASLDAILRDQASRFPVVFGPAGISLDERTPVLSLQTEHCLTLVVLGGVGLGAAIAKGIRHVLQIRTEKKLGDKAEAEASLARGRDRREEAEHTETMKGLDAKRRLDEANIELAQLEAERVRRELRDALSELKTPMSNNAPEAAAAALQVTAGAVVYQMPTLRSVKIEGGDTSETIDLAS